MVSTSYLLLGKTSIAQISRKELAKIRDKLKTTPKRTLKEIRECKREEPE